MTGRRKMILELLRNTSQHPTAGEVYQMVRERMPHISLGTVYRNLEILREAGMIQELEGAGRQKRFDANINNHYHVRCISCSRVEDLPVGIFAGIEEGIDGMSDFDIVGHRLEYLGVCRGCRRRRVDCQKGVRKNARKEETKWS